MSLQHRFPLEESNDSECPVCGRRYDDVVELPKRIEDGEVEPTPGRVYDHSGTSSGSCIEWADGRVETSAGQDN